MLVAAEFEKMKENYKFPFERLKEKQIRVVEVVLKGEDCFAIFEWIK